MLYELLGLWMGVAMCLLLSCQPGPVRVKLPRARALSSRRMRDARVWPADPVEPADIDTPPGSHAPLR